MKQAVSLAVALVLLAGCGRRREPPAGAPPPPRPAAVGPKAAVRAPLPVVSFLVASASVLDPESEARKAASQAQGLFLQGQTNAAIDVLGAAIRRPDVENGRHVLVCMLVSLLMASGRDADAQAIGLEYATAEDDRLFCGPLIASCLIERGDAAAAVIWTERLAALPLPPEAADLNFGDHLAALSAAGRLDEALERVPGMLMGADPARNVALVRSVATRMIAGSDFAGAEGFLSAVEAAAGGKEPYVGAVSNGRAELTQARARPADAAPER